MSEITPLIMHATVRHKIGSLYSWLMKQPESITLGLRSVADAEKLFDRCAMAGHINLFDSYPSAFIIAAIGYDPMAPENQPPAPAKPAKPKRATLPPAKPQAMRGPRNL